MAQTIKNPPSMWETWDRSLGWGDPLEEDMATHSSILAWRISTDRRNLVGYSPCGHKETDRAEQSAECSTQGRQTSFTSIPLWDFQSIPYFPF